MKKKIALLLAALILCAAPAFAALQFINLDVMTIDELEKLIADATAKKDELTSKQTSDVFTEYALSLGSAWRTQKAELEAFKAGRDAAMERYYEASHELWEELLVAALKGAEFTKDDELRLQGLETKIYNSLIDSINNEYAGSISHTQYLWGDDANASDPTYMSLIYVMESSRDGLILKADETSQKLRAALGSVFKDGALTINMRVELTALLNEYNEVMAKIEERSRL